MKNITFVGFGDSLTYGYGVYGGVSFMNRLKASLPEAFPNINWRIINSGINGNTTREGVSRIKSDVLDYKPDIVTILFGSNDSALNEYQHRALYEFEENLKTITEKILNDTSAEIIFITPPPLIEDDIFPFTTNKAVKLYSDVIKKTADSYGCRLIDFNCLLADTARGNLAPYLQYDGLHLSDKGYNVIFKLVFEEIKDIVRTAL